jgi:hypothetical protein
MYATAAMKAGPRKGSSRNRPWPCRTSWPDSEDVTKVRLA